MNAQHAMYFAIPFLLVFSWVIFAWWGRGRLVQNAFEKKFTEFLDDSPEINFRLGHIYKAAKNEDKQVFLFAQFTVIGMRFKWYLIASDETASGLKARPSLIGEGLTLGYFQNTNPEIPTFDKNVLNSVSSVPKQWDFVFAKKRADFYFYAMPDFIGYSPLSELKHWISTSG